MVRATWRDQVGVSGACLWCVRGCSWGESGGASRVSVCVCECLSGVSGLGWLLTVCQ